MIQIADVFEYNGQKPLDIRIKYDSVANMVATPTTSLYDGCLAYVTATKTYYTYDSTNDVDATLGKWRELETGGGADNIVEGYFNEADDLFYEESTFVTPIAGAPRVIYIDLVNNWTYRFEDPIFVRLDEEVSNDVVDGYYYNGEFYGNAAHSVQIPHRYNRVYIDVPTNKMYRYAGIADGYVCINEGQITQVDTLPTADVNSAGKIYQYVGATGTYTCGYFYVCVEDSDNPGTYLWEQINVQPDNDTQIQVETMPTAASTLEDKIVQYVGATDSTYTNGFFYKCIEDTDTPGTYKWEAVSVQSGGSGGGTLGKDITASVAVGGIKVGDAYTIGTNYDDMWQDLLDPIKYPSLTNPSATISASGTLLETGASVSKTLTVNFSRGTISPAYGTSGYRSGAATGYSLNNGTSQSGNTFTQTVSESNKTFKAKVTYAAGEQPLDSKGNNYSTPLAAGSVETSTLTFDFADAIWANTSAINTVAKLALVSKSTKVKEFNFPAQTVANPEEFHIPASWSVTAVEVLNTLSNQWESCASEFTTGTTTHNNAGGTAVNYVTYKDNRGYAAAARKVRVKWS